ncbi:Tex family protein [Dethiosulfatarculus sandiegensis]|uniref:RNA-binding protein n=1 Tax=Dethiosulfatarculus sandiegensis TaxID=1429043 RepID=A0A0D2HXE3_9BACT|nr:Tex family protein [Dethiosulfatarculus sandiegensis]KIX14993.1 RNA-binding protein [Dethiosulfatarculus sandiegensis]
MKDRNIAKVAQELELGLKQVSATAELLENGSTVPFIARYRKEATGALDEVAIVAIRDRLGQLKDMDERRSAIIKSLTERELLTPELESKVEAAETMATLEDVYLPFRPKRRTRAMQAREKGLEPLAETVFAQNNQADPLTKALEFVDPEKEVENPEDALAGARDIIAEWINEDSEARAHMRELFEKKALITCKVGTGQEEEGAKYKDYFDWSEPAKSAPSHRVLAMRRGEKEGFLLFRIAPDQEEALALLGRLFLKGPGLDSEQVEKALVDSYKRLLCPAMETEMRLLTKKKAEKEAVKVFAENLRQLLLAAPLGLKRVLALDPGYRTGCKVACMDRQGALLHHDLINILSAKNREDARQKLTSLCEEYRIEVLAVGNGTASRECEALCKSLELNPRRPVYVVSESGASVYSASDVARREFPDLDVSVRGAVSIGRRLLDPLAELVKIDPKAIGVGQYQHDVDQGDLKRSLDDVVVSCVNAVGVEVNTASPELLSHVSGLGPALAKNIVNTRQENGPFSTRRDLMKVPRLGPKAFQQAAGFLRIRNGENPLDASAVHPESYPLVEKIAGDLECQVVDLLKSQSLRKNIDPSRYVTEEVGLPTINDILTELEKPGRDPRQGFEEFSFAEGVEKPEDLETGMRLPGVVTNVTNFGAFVDIGVHRDGLVHVSELADSFVSDPRQVVKVQQKVMVTVLEVDQKRNRISLSMRSARPEKDKGKPQDASPQGQGKRPPRGGGGKKARPKGAKPQPKVFNDAFARQLSKLTGN